MAAQKGTVFPELRRGFTIDGIMQRRRPTVTYFFPDNLNAESRFRIFYGEGQELVVGYKFSAFPGGITKSRLGVKVMRGEKLGCRS